ncbi:MAG: SurA N-terminal domain-containing protein, partial [Alphaproteobacteria bacterium]
MAAAGLLAAFAAFPPAAALAQGVMRIAAVVNDDVISAYDLNQRVRMVMITGRIPDTPENKRRLAEQVLRNMIDEQLQLQEAKRLNISVSDEDVNRLLAKLNAQNKVPAGTLESILTRS